jgi:transposase
MWAKHADFLLTLVAEQPDLTLDEIVTIMRKHKIRGKRTSVWRFFQRHKITFKKSLRATWRGRERVGSEHSPCLIDAAGDY